MENEETEEGKKAGEEGDSSTEQIFKSKEEVPSRGQQLTIKSVVVSVLLGFLFTFIVLRLSLSTGIIPSLNVVAGLLGVFFIKLWSTILSKFGFLSSDYANYILGMTNEVAKQGDALGNSGNNVEEMHFLWMLIFVSVVSFVGLFSIVPLRKIMILLYKLTYPSGTATTYLINSSQTPKGAKLAKKQVGTLFKWFSTSFVWAFFQWFCPPNFGFSAFPTSGLEVYKYKFYFDFSSTYVGVGMICPYSISMLLGAVVSWGLMWPLIEKQRGTWYDKDAGGSSLRGLQGYKVFIAIALILGDGLFHFVSVLVKTSYRIWKTYKSKDSKKDTVAGDNSSENTTKNSMSYDDQCRTQFFLKDQMKVAAPGYSLLAALAIVVVPVIFHPLKPYHIALTYIFAPILAFCNSYRCGITDRSLASSCGKIAIFLFGSWVGINIGVAAGLAVCGVMLGIVSTACHLMQHLKTGYLTLESPRSVFFSQIIGTALGCILSVFVFWFFFYNAFPTLGELDSAYPAPFALLISGITLISIEGRTALPRNCLTLSIAFFVLAIVLNLIREVLVHYKIQAHKYVPSAMAMAIPFNMGGYRTISMCIGSLIRFLWEAKNKGEADAFLPATASGMICGDLLWGMPAAILSLAGVKPPPCMKFLSRTTNAKVYGFLRG